MGRKGKNKGGGGAQTAGNAEVSTQQVNVTPVDAVKVPEIQKPAEQPQIPAEPLKPASDVKVPTVEVSQKPVEIPKTPANADGVSGTETNDISKDGTGKKKKKNKNKQLTGENVTQSTQPPKAQPQKTQPLAESKPTGEVSSVEGVAAPGDTGTAKKKRNKKKKAAQQAGDQHPVDGNAAPILPPKPVEQSVDGEATLKKKKNKKDKKREAAANLEKKEAGETKVTEQPDLKKEEPKVDLKPVAKVEEVKTETVQTPPSPAVTKEEEHKKNKKDNKNQQKEQGPAKVVEQKPDSVKTEEAAKSENKVEQVQESKKQGNEQKKERKDSESNKKSKNADKKPEIKKEEKKHEEKKVDAVKKPESDKEVNQPQQQQKKEQQPKNDQNELKSQVAVQQPQHEKPKPDSPTSQDKKQLPKTDVQNKKNDEPKVVAQEVVNYIVEEKKPEPPTPRYIKCAMFGPTLPEDEKKSEQLAENKTENKKIEEKKVEQKKVEEKKVEAVKEPEKSEKAEKIEKQQQKKDKPELSVAKPEKTKSESPKSHEKKQSPKPEVKEATKVELPKVASEKPLELPTVEKVLEAENIPKVIKCAMFGPEVITASVEKAIPSKVQEVTPPNVPELKPILLPEKKLAQEIIPMICPAAKPEIKPTTIAESISAPLQEAKVEKTVEVTKPNEIKPVTPNKEMDKQLLNAALTELIDSVSKMNLSEPKAAPAENKSNTIEEKKNLQPQQPKQDTNKRNKSKSPRPETKQVPKQENKQDQKNKGKNNEKNKAVKADTDIPMDMSVISKSSIEDAVTADKALETSKNSKNEQRSDFVPSVEQQPKQSSAKSQGNDNKNQSDKKNDAESVRQAQNVTPASNKRSKDEANLKQTETIAELKTHELPEKTAQEKMDAVTVPVKLLDILDAKMTTPTESTQAKSSKAPQPSPQKKDEKKQDASSKQKNPKEQQPKKQNKGPSDTKQSKTPPPGKKPDGKQPQQEKTATGSKNELIPKEIKLEDNLKVESLSEVKPLPSNPPNVLLGSNTSKVEPEQKSVATASTTSPLKPQGIKPVIPPKPVALGIKKSPSPPVSSKQDHLPSPGTSNPKQSEKLNKPEILPKPTNVPAPPTKKPPPPPVDEDEEYIEYKISPRPVFLSTICQICKTPLKQFTTCSLCQMVSYCSEQHMKDDLPVHKDLCSAIQDIAKKRGGHLYNNAKILNNEDFRSLRTHTMLICENVLKRQLQLFEREILLYPRICATHSCREWRTSLLVACPECGQTSYCVHHPDHLPATHKIWCKSYSLFQKLVLRQKNSGRIEPSLPSKIMQTEYKLPTTMDGVFKDLYKNNSILKDECSHAALSLVATAPLTALSAAQKCNIEIPDKFVIHLIGAELQFEADTLDKWEAFFLHLVPQLVELRIVFIGPELNAENLPLEVLSRIRMCRACRQSARAVKFDFQCGKLYHEYVKSSSFTKPDLVCFFNPGLYRPTGFNGLDTWPETIRATTIIGCPIVITSYTEYESPMDLARLEKESKRELKIIHAPAINPFASQRPDRNFISDEIVPMIFKNYFLFIVK